MVSDYVINVSDCTKICLIVSQRFRIFSQCVGLLQKGIRLFHKCVGLFYKSVRLFHKNVGLFQKCFGLSHKGVKFFHKLSDCFNKVSDCLTKLLNCLKKVSDCFTNMSDYLTNVSDCFTNLSDCFTNVSDCLIKVSDYFKTLLLKTCWNRRSGFKQIENVGRSDLQHTENVGVAQCIWNKCFNSEEHQINTSLFTWNRKPYMFLSIHYLRAEIAVNRRHRLYY